jgi:hypothetical protein
MKEMQEALKTCVGSSPGPDGINYEMINQLGEKEKDNFLGIYNNLWQQGSFPEVWRTALTYTYTKTR